MNEESYEFSELESSGIDAVSEEDSSGVSSGLSEVDSSGVSFGGDDSVDMETMDTTETTETVETAETAEISSDGIPPQVSSSPLPEYVLWVPAGSIPASPVIQPDSGELVPVSEPQEAEPLPDTVDTLVDILAQVLASDEDTSSAQEEPASQEELSAALQESIPVTASDTAGMDLVLERLDTIQLQTSLRPALITPFEDYTVSEGLLLLLLLFVFISFCVKMLRRAFSWLL